MAKKKEVIITCNATNVKAVIEGLERGMASLAAEEEKLLNTIKQRGYAENDEKKRLKELEKAMDAMRTNVQKNREEQKKLAEVMKDLAGSKLKDLKKALQEGKAALNNMSANDPKRAKLVRDLKLIQRQIDANTGAIKAQGNAFATTAKNLATYMIGFAGFNKLKSMVEGVFQANMKLSDSLANIRKVSGLSGEAINQLYRNITKIDTRNTIEMLNQLAYTGAKLGIGQNYGVEGLTGFVKAAEQVQMALGEDMGEKALPELSKMVEVMGLIPKYGVEQSMQKAASAIFQLGATSTATGSNIVEFSKRLMGLANVSRVSTQDLLALGSASDAMGLMPEVSATAFNKLFTAIQRQHNLIEKTLGMEKGRIRQLYDEGKTMDAIVEIFNKMNQKGNMNLLGTVFKDLGSDGARLINVMATMADRVDILEKHLKTSRNAFKEGEAVIGEYMIQNQTAQAMLERASNLWAKAFTNPDGVDMVKQLAQAWYDVSKEITQSDGLMFSLRNSIDFIAYSIGKLIKLFPYLIKLGISFGLIFAGKSIYLGVQSLVQAFRMLWTEIKIANTWGQVLKVTLNSNWILAAVAALASFVALLWDFASASKEAAEREAEHQRDLQKSFAKSKENIENVVKPLNTFKKALEDSTLSEKQRMEMIKQFKTDYQDYLDYLGIEIQSAVDLAKAYAQVVKVMKQKKAYEERENYRTEKNGENRMDRIAAQAQVEAAARSLGIEGINKAYLEGSQNVDLGDRIRRKGTNEVLKDIFEKKYGITAIKSESDGVQFLEVNGKLVSKGTKYNKYTDKIRYRKFDDEALRNALNNYIASYRTEFNLNKEIDDMFNAEYRDIDLEHFNIDEFNDRVQRAQWKRKGSLENEKPDTKAQKELKKAQQAEKKALKLEMDQAQKDSTAVINAIEEFYRLQESAVEQLVADGKMTREEADKLIEYVKNRKDKMLMNARRAIAGKDSDFEDLRKTMGEDMLRPGDVNSQRALNTVQTIDVAEAARRLQKFNGSKAVYDLNAGSFTQAMLKNAAQNELNIQRRQAAVQQEIDKLLLQYQFVEQAQRDFGDKLVKLGLVTDGYDKVVQQLADGTEIVANTREVQSLAAKVVGMGSRLYAANPESSAALKQLIQEVMTDGEGNPESFASIFPSLSAWMKHPDEYKEQMRSLYEMMIQYEGTYYDKLKQRDDLQRKRLDSWWDHSDQKKANDKQLRALQLYDFQYNTMNEGQTMGFMMGLTNDLSRDPEVMREQAVLEAKIAIWKKAKEEREANLISEEVYQERLQAMQDQTMAYSKKVMENINNRISRIQNMVKPVETAAKSIGQKLGDMILNMESDSATWDEIWKNMALAVAESLMSMVGQYAQYQIAKSAINKSEIADEAVKAQAITMLGISSGAAKTIGTLGWWGIALIPVITQLLMGLLTSALNTASKSTGASSNSTKTGTNTKLVSTMLTYDAGNIQHFIGQDGRVYAASVEPAPRDGLITHPIATTVQGQPALVAEKGPEIVLGRETTRAIMMNEPELIRYLANYQQHGGRRLFDEGTPAPLTVADGSPSGSSLSPDDARTLIAAIATFNRTVEQMQQKGIPCYINKYGTGGLIDEVKSGLKFDQRYGG